MIDHVCRFPAIEIVDAEDDENLKTGMEVLIPCPDCGLTPYDHIKWMEARQEEMSASLLAVEPLRPLYHWTPKIRRKQIIRYGLRPHMKPTTTVGEDRRIPYICFADSPSWAWALSGAMKWGPTGEWDLWMTWQDKLVDPQVMASPDRHTGIYEIRTEHRVYKRDLWYVGSRVKI